MIWRGRRDCSHKSLTVGPPNLWRGQGAERLVRQCRNGTPSQLKTDRQPRAGVVCAVPGVRDRLVTHQARQHAGHLRCGWWDEASPNRCRRGQGRDDRGLRLPLVRIGFCPCTGHSSAFPEALPFGNCPPIHCSGSYRVGHGATSARPRAAHQRFLTPVRNTCDSRVSGLRLRITP